MQLQVCRSVEDVETLRRNGWARTHTDGKS